VKSLSSRLSERSVNSLPDCCSVPFWGDIITITMATDTADTVDTADTDMDTDIPATAITADHVIGF
jgi:hypothetical protein